MTKLPKWLTVSIVLMIAYFTSAVLIPFFMSIFLVMLLEPVVQQLTKYSFSRKAAAAFTVTVFLCGAALVVWLAYLASIKLASDLPMYIGHLKSWIGNLREKGEFLNLSQSFWDSLSLYNDENVQKVKLVETYPAWTQYLVRGVGSFYELFSVVIFVPILLYYLLIDKHNLLESFNAVSGAYFYIPKLNSELPSMVRNYFIANLLTGALLICAHSLLFAGLGLSNWAVLGFFSGFLNLVPILGAPLAMIPGLLQTISQVETSPAPLIIIFVSTLVLHFVANNIVLPHIYGTRSNLNTATIIMGFLFWGWLWGAMGFILAIPMTSLVKILLESNSETYPISNLMAAKPRHVFRGLQ